jgi:hypothetical protein
VGWIGGLKFAVNIKIYTHIILAVVLNGRETLYLTLNESDSRKVYKNRVMMEVQRVRERWEQLHDEELHGDVRVIRSIKADGIGEACGTNGEY